MNAMRCGPLICLACLSSGLVALSGCQTNVAGMTLPSPHYLQHPPQFIPPSPPYPLPRELASQEATYGAGVIGPEGVAPGAQLPPPVPAPGMAVPGPGPAPLPAPVPVPGVPGP